jgi:hypothetical protein
MSKLEALVCIAQTLYRMRLGTPAYGGDARAEIIAAVADAAKLLDCGLDYRRLAKEELYCRYCLDQWVA